MILKDLWFKIWIKTVAHEYPKGELGRGASILRNFEF